MESLIWSIGVVFHTEVFGLEEYPIPVVQIHEDSTFLHTAVGLHTGLTPGQLPVEEVSWPVVRQAVCHHVYLEEVVAVF